MSYLIKPFPVRTISLGKRAAGPPSFDWTAKKTTTDK